jgi:hypothetical protein
VTPTSDEPTAQAQAIMEQVLKLVTECRVVLCALERPEAGESSSAEAERILYFTLMSAIDDGLVGTMEDALRVLRHASQPPGPMGAEWLERLVESDSEDWRTALTQQTTTSNLQNLLLTGSPP